MGQMWNNLAIITACKRSYNTQEWQCEFQDANEDLLTVLPSCHQLYNNIYQKQYPTVKYTNFLSCCVFTHRSRYLAWICPILYRWHGFTWWPGQGQIHFWASPDSSGSPYDQGVDRVGCLQGVWECNAVHCTGLSFLISLSIHQTWQKKGFDRYVHMPFTPISMWNDTATKLGGRIVSRWLFSPAFLLCSPPFSSLLQAAFPPPRSRGSTTPN